MTAGSRIAQAKRKRPNLSTHDRSSSNSGVSLATGGAPPFRALRGSCRNVAKYVADQEQVHATQRSIAVKTRPRTRLLVSDGSHPPDRSVSQVGAVRLGDQLKVMPGRVVEIHAPAAVVGVDLTRRVAGTSPERHALGLDALNGPIKHVVGDE